jgi:hypothetical protein
LRKGVFIGVFHALLLLLLLIWPTNPPPLASTVDDESKTKWLLYHVKLQQKGKTHYNFKTGENLRTGGKRLLFLQQTQKIDLYTLLEGKKRGGGGKSPAHLLGSQEIKLRRSGGGGDEMGQASCSRIFRGS